MDQEPDVKPWATIRELDINTQSFEANGHKYYVAKSVSLDRWEAYELFQVEVGFARTFEQLHDGIGEALTLCNQVATGKEVFADMVMLLRDLHVGVALIGEKQTPSVLKLCALFINREGEDVRYISTEQMQQKIEDWKVAGISIGYFFRFAMYSIPGFIEAYKAVSRDTSAEAVNDMADQGEVSKNGSRT